MKGMKGMKLIHSCLKEFLLLGFCIPNFVSVYCLYFLLSLRFWDYVIPSCYRRRQGPEARVYSYAPVT
jgi:hypothetical protein